MNGMENNLKFGFGCMRLPLQDPGDITSFDFETIQTLFDAFLDEGFSYFDTAYTYHGYRGEKAVRKALVERHPRDRFQLATKLPLRDFKDADDMESIFNEQLENCGVEYFDYYLLHNMGHNVYEKCREHDAFGFVRRKKEEGRIRHIGMSFHDTPELLEQILEEYGHTFDFLQLQINYIDWEHPGIQSKHCLEIANKYQKPVVVMEPAKGGTLANLPEEAHRLMKDYAPGASTASWAFRFAAEQKGVFMVLSGMNSLDQVKDNTRNFKNLKPLNAEEKEILRKVVDLLNAQTAVACTGCGYCAHDCPEKIAIPQYFALYNSAKRTTGSFSSQMVYYNNISLNGHGKASQCIGCGKCEAACPQHLPIREYLEDVVEEFEKKRSFPKRQ